MVTTTVLATTVLRFACGLQLVAMRSNSLLPGLLVHWLTPVSFFQVTVSNSEDVALGARLDVDIDGDTLINKQWLTPNPVYSYNNPSVFQQCFSDQ